MSNENKDWEKTKREWKNKIEAVNIPEEVQGRITQLESKLDTLFMQATWEHTEVKNQYDKVNAVIDEVKKLNKEGKNVDERKKNAIQACKNYEGLDLLEYKREIKEKVDFYEKYVLNVISDKSNRLNANIGAMKIDAQLTPHK